MRLESLSLAFSLLSVVTAAAPDFLAEFPASAGCSPYSNTTASADLWCKITASDDSSGCCLIHTTNWSKDRVQDTIQKWCDSVRANITVKSLDCSSDTDDSSPYSLFGGLGDDDDSSETASSSSSSSSSSDSQYDSNDDYSNSDDNNVLSRSAIVGIVMGVIAGLFIFIILVSRLARSQHSSRPPKTTSTSWRIPDLEQAQPPRQNSSREPVLPVRVSTPPPVYSAPPPAYHA